MRPAPGLLCICAALAITGTALAASTFSTVISGPGPERATSVISLASGGYLAAGMSAASYGGRSDILLMELDSEGDTLWTSILGGPGDEVPAGMISAPDGGVWIGLTAYDGDPDHGEATLLRLDESMDTVWCTGLEAPSRASDITLLQDGSCLMVGARGTQPTETGMAALFGQSGDTLWTETYQSGTASSLTSVAAMADGAVCCGRSQGSLNVEAWFLRLDAAGGVTSENTFGSGDAGTEASGIIVTGDGCVIAGSAESGTTGVSNMYMAMTDSTGTLQWDTTFGGNKWERAAGLCPAGDGYLLYGYARSYSSGEINRSELFMVRTDRWGGFIWDQTHGTNAPDYCWSAAQCDDGGFVLAGCVTAFGGPTHYDAWVLRVDSLGQISPQGMEPEPGGIPFTAGVTENPCSGTTGVRLVLDGASEVEILLFDIFGRLTAAPVENLILPAGEHLLRIAVDDTNGAPLPAGVYLLQVRACGSRASFGLTVLGGHR